MRTIFTSPEESISSLMRACLFRRHDRKVDSPLFIVALLVTVTQPGNTTIMETRPMGDRLDSFLMAAGGAVFVGATAGMLSGREPFATWYSSFAWWSYIVFADAWLHHRTGRRAILRNRQAPQVFALD